MIFRSDMSLICAMNPDKKAYLDQVKADVARLLATVTSHPDPQFQLASVAYALTEIAKEKKK